MVIYSSALLISPAKGVLAFRFLQKSPSSVFFTLYSSEVRGSSLHCVECQGKTNGLGSKFPIFLKFLFWGCIVQIKKNFNVHFSMRISFSYWSFMASYKFYNRMGLSSLYRLDCSLKLPRSNFSIEQQLTDHWLCTPCNPHSLAFLLNPFIRFSKAKQNKAKYFSRIRHLLL